jgi:hypothetical protein
MASSDSKAERQIIEKLAVLNETPPREPQAVARGRSQFLSTASSMQKAVSPSAFRRLKDWIASKNIRYRKERSPMLATISSIIIALAVVLGGGGITVFAAQDSLPDEALYPVKLYLEDARLGLTADPVTQISLLTAFANNRVDEIVGLAGQGEAVPNRVLTRLQTHLQTMLRLTAGLDDDTAIPALQQIRQQLRTQEQLMSQLGQTNGLDPALEQLRAMLQEQHRLVQQGLEEPLKFQQQYRHGESEPPGSPAELDQPNGNQYGDCTEPGDCEPVEDGTGPGPGAPGGNPDPGGDGSGDGNSGQNGNQGEEKPPENGGSGNGNGGDPGGKGPGSGK